MLYPVWFLKYMFMLAPGFETGEMPLILILTKQGGLFIHVWFDWIICENLGLYWIILCIRKQPHILR